MPRKKDKNAVISMTEFIARNVEAGNYRLVDIAGERKKDKLIGVEEFADRLSKYTLDDYLHSDQPYYDLLECSRAQPGLFDQLAEVLIDTAKQQMHAKNKYPYTKKVKEKISFTREVHLPDLAEASSILDYINQVEADPETADKVSVLPLMCGSGKSTAITLKIKEVIERGEGMLIVTDSNKRLEEIWNENTDSPLLGEDVKAFIKAHKNDVTIMTKDTYANAIKCQWQYPVLAMTTQRFFNVLTKDEIQQFLKWKDKGTRSLILFDEEPYLNKIIDLTPKDVNVIDTLLRMNLIPDEETLLTEDKQWCIRQWEIFRQRFLDLLWKYEYDHEGSMFYHEDDQHLTEDDDRFFRIINQNKTGIRSDSISNYNNIHAFKVFADTWGVYSHRTSGSYESKFTVYLDNSEKVQGLGAKVIVLDGTGDISPIYSGQDYIDMRSGQNFVRSLSHLTIKTGDIDTSKANLTVRNSPVPKTIENYLDDETEYYDKTYIFTYKDKEEKFGWYCNEQKTAHFGAIKGLYEYQDAECIAQVGLNELQPVHYLVHLLARNEELRTRMAGLSPEENCEQIRKIMRETNNCAEIKVAHILADVDQNMFRSAIRSAKNRNDVTFYLFYKHSYIPQLREAIRDRYCGLLGASMVVVKEEDILEYQPYMKETIADVIYRWYCEWDGSLKKREVIAEEIGISAGVLKVIISRDDRLRPLFAEAKAAGKEITGKNGYYAKREQ
ncbi:MAG: hypothetical protein IKE15_11410 [Clostridia bacterium]|nr:hypothetical protein [Clostridia bacterium]